MSVALAGAQDRDFTIDALRVGGFTAELGSQIPPKGLRADYHWTFFLKVVSSTLKQISFTAKDFRSFDVPAKHLHEAGFPAIELMQVGYSAKSCTTEASCPAATCY